MSHQRVSLTGLGGSRPDAWLGNIASGCRRLIIGVLFFLVIGPNRAHASAPTQNQCGYRAHMWAVVQETAAYLSQAGARTQRQLQNSESRILVQMGEVSATYGYQIQIDRLLSDALVNAMTDAQLAVAFLTSPGGNLSFAGVQYQKYMGWAQGQIAAAWKLINSVPATCPKSPPSAAPLPSSRPLPSSHLILATIGSGQSYTPTFKVPSRWSISWDFDCSDSSGGIGNFLVEVYDSSSRFFDLAVNDLGSGRSGTSYEHRSGTYYLKIGSDCSWGFAIHR